MTTDLEAAHLRALASKCRQLAEDFPARGNAPTLRKLAEGYEAEALRCAGVDGLARPWLYDERRKPT
jgi:hypothetical protein